MDEPTITDQLQYALLVLRAIRETNTTADESLSFLLTPRERLQAAIVRTLQVLADEEQEHLRVHSSEY